jgi:hypothetical protein
MHSEYVSESIPDTAKYVRFSYNSTLTPFRAQVLCLDAVHDLITKAYNDDVDGKSTDLIVKPEDFEGNTMADKVIAANAFINAGGGGFTFYFGETSTYLITEAITIPSNTTIIIDNCTIKLSNSIHDNVIRTANIIPNPLQPNELATCTETVENIKIIGKGNAVSCGPDVKYYGPTKESEESVRWVGDAFGWRGHGVLLVGAEHFEVRGLKYENMICFCSYFVGCHYGEITDINCYSLNKNNDTIDITTGSHDIIVSNIYGISSDDIVCISTCDEGRGPGHTQGASDAIYPLMPIDYTDYTFGDDTYNIKVSNVCAETNAYRLDLLTGKKEVYNIHASNLSDIGHSSAGIFNVWGAWMDTYQDGNIHDIYVNNIICNNATYAIVFNGMPHDSLINKVTANNGTTPIRKYGNLPSYNEANCHVTNIIENE